MQENNTYEQALVQLSNITSAMEQGKMSIDEMAAQLRQARSLLAFCRERLNEAQKDCTEAMA